MNRLFSYIVSLYFRLSFMRQVIWTLLLSLVFIIATVLIFQGGDISTKPVGWEKSFYVSSYGIQAGNINVSSEGRYVVAVYEARGRKRDFLYCAVSFNGGRDFITPVKIADASSKIEKKPHVAISGSGRLAVVWQDYIAREAKTGIFMSTSEDFGATWSKPGNITFGHDMEMLPMVFFDDSGLMHLFFHGLRDGLFNLYHAMEKGGKLSTTSSLVPLKEQMKGAFFPAISVEGRRIFVVWQGRGNDFNDNLYFTRSGNGGRSWSSIKKLTRTQGNNASPSLVLRNDTLYCAYQNNDDKTWDIRLLRGRRFGNDWDEKPITISSTDVNCYAPGIAASAEEIIMAWYDKREKNANIYLRKYSLSDGSLSEEIRLSEHKRGSEDPSLAFSGGRVIAFWEEAGRVMAKYNDITVSAPEVFSRTHSEDAWSRRSTAVIEWKRPKDESGIAGYLVSVNDLPDFTPPDIVRIKPTTTKRVLPELSDGKTYFHIRAVDGAGNVSRTVHYKIRVSSNPPPMPLVVSPTHKEGAETESDSPVFRWAVDDPDRLKGFYYSVTKGGISDPEKFTSSFELQLKDLQQGGYFFTISSIDKTNQIGPPATYYFIVGRAEKIDVEKIKKIARGKPLRQREKRLREPSVHIAFPFPAGKAFAEDAFIASITIKKTQREYVEGFSVYSGKTKMNIPKKINTSSHTIPFRNLKDGSYYIGVRCRYSRIEGGRKAYYWTKPVYASFTIVLPPEVNPFEFYISDLLKKFTGRFVLTSVLIMLLLGMTVILGFGTRFVFYMRLFQFKCITVFRLIFG